MKNTKKNKLVFCVQPHCYNKAIEGSIFCKYHGDNYSKTKYNLTRYAKNGA